MSHRVQRKAFGKRAFSGDIRFRLILVIVLISLVTLSASIIFSLQRDMKRIRQASVATNLVRLKALKIDFVKVIIGYSPDYAVDLVDRLHSFTDMLNVILYDNAGKLVFRYDRSSQDQLSPPESFDSTEASAITQGDGALLMHHTVTYEGKRFGWVTVRASTLALQDQIRHYTGSIFFSIIGTLAIAVVLSSLVGYYFINPVRNLAAFFRRVSRTREFDRQVYTREGGDIGDLYTGVNKMLKEITVAEAEIRRLSEGRLRNIIESSLDGVVSIDAEGLIVYWGKQNIKIFGWLEQEVLGKPLADIIIPERYRKQHSDGVRKFKIAGSNTLLRRRVKLSGIHRDGHEFPLEYSVSASKEAGGWILNAFIRDLTELVEAEQGLLDTQEQLLRKERLAAVGQLTATVAHELRNPMGTIRNSLYSLGKKPTAMDADTLRLMQRIDRNVQRCDVIISDLLDFTRDRKIIMRPVEVHDWLRRLLDHYDCPKQVALHYTLASHQTVLLDTAYLESAVINVLDNALQAVLERHPDGGGQVKIDVISEADRLGLVIGDNGSGIPQEEQLRVFEPLYSTRVYGVGLGLPTVKKIMEKHGGEVVLESKAGAGTSITLWLKSVHE